MVTKKQKRGYEPSVCEILPIFLKNKIIELKWVWLVLFIETILWKISPVFMPWVEQAPLLATRPHLELFFMTNMVVILSIVLITLIVLLIYAVTSILYDFIKGNWILAKKQARQGGCN